MNVLIHIYNKYDELRGGYLSPIMQAENYKTFKPLLVLTHNNRISDIVQEKSLENIILTNENYEKLFMMLRLRTFSLDAFKCYIKHTKELIKIIRNNNIKIIHVQNFESFILSYLASKITKVKIINHIRGNNQLKKMKLFFSISDYILCVSESVKQSIISIDNKNEKKLFVVNNGVEIPSYQYISNKNNEVNIGLIGYISAIKGQYEFIKDIWSELEKKYNYINLLLVGSVVDVSYCKKVEEQIKLMGLKKIEFLGEQVNIDQWYKKMDIVVNYSESEGFPRTVLEAFSYGIPVIGSFVAGNKDIITNDCNGYCIDRDNRKLFIEKLEYLIKNNEKRVLMGKNGKKIVGEKYSIELSAKNIENIYCKIIGLCEF